MPNSLRESSWIVLVAGAGDGSALGEGTGANGGGEAEEARCLPRRAEEEPCATAEDDGGSGDSEPYEARPARER